MRVIVIDDDPGIRDQLDAVAAGIDAALFDVAASDAEAYACLTGPATYDVALVSIDSPRLAGLAFFQRLPAPAQRLPRIALTDGSDLARIRAALAAGANDFLVKPLLGVDLEDTVARVIGQVERRRRSWQERAAYSALRRELDLAADMQRCILPSSFPCLPGFDVHAHMRPAGGIGGDFYDLFELAPGRIGFVIGDVAGKGIPAAFYMAIASTALRSAALAGATPARCLGEVNDFLVRRDIPGMFVSVCYGVLDTLRWEVECANAGHPPPVLVEPGCTPRAFDCAGGPVLGVVAGQHYTASRLDLAAGAALVLYTDGVTEANDGHHGNAYGTHALLELLAQRAEAPARSVTAACSEALLRHVGTACPQDDFTVLVLRRSAAAGAPRAAA